MQAEDIVKARIWCLDKDAWSVDLQFNPSDLDLSRSISMGKDEGFFGPYGGKPEFENGTPDELAFTILVDTSVGGEIDLADAGNFETAMLSALNSLLGSANTNDDSILPQIQDLYRLTLPIKPAGATEDFGDNRPPVCAFVWEQFEFMGFVVSLDVDFLVFDASGRPKRAEVKVKMEGRAFSGALDLKGFLEASYTTPSASGTGARAGQSSRDDLADFL
jgi:hypothetical protein